MGKRKACPSCGGFNLQIWALGKVRCKGCNRAFSVALLVSADYTPSKSRAKSTRRQADKQEKRTAKKLGARQTIASGQTPIDKADVKSEYVRAECKYTDKKSFVMKRSDLAKVSAACTGGQIPAFMVEFREFNETYYTISEGWFLQLLEAYKHDQND